MPETPPSFFQRNPLLGWLRSRLRQFWEAMKRFVEIEGEQHASSFGFYAFFSLFPLILLFVTIGSLFWDHEMVLNYIIENIGHYLPLNSTDRSLVDSTIRGITEKGKGLGAIAVLGLLWTSSRFFHALVRGVNCAWRTKEYPWWRLPIRSFLMLVLVASALFIGVVMPLILTYLPQLTFLRTVFVSDLSAMATLFVPSLILFYGLCMFFKFAPRRQTRFGEVVFPAVVTTCLLQVCRALFARYVYEFSNINMVYGAVAIVIVLLLWIYLSGVLIIYGGCLCAVQAEKSGQIRAAAPK